MKLEPVRLEGRFVRLEPLSAEHAPGLVHAGEDESIWRHMPFRIASEEDARGWIRVASGMLAAGVGLVFATHDRESGELVGSTGFLAAAPEHGRVEIGATWITPGRQRTAVNTEAKYLMMRHAFECWGCLRVEFKTDSRNQRSRAALARIGAREEGTLRAHMLLPDGRRRDSVYFSVIESEWPDVKQRLEGMLDR